jgi:hypothetical protein
MYDCKLGCVFMLKKAEYTLTFSNNILVNFPGLRAIVGLGLLIFSYNMPICYAFVSQELKESFIVTLTR